MSNGVHVERDSDGNVRIVATAKGGTVKLRVTPEYARALASQLINASYPTAREASIYEALLEGLRKGGGLG